MENIVRMILMVVLKYHASMMRHVLMYQHLELVPLVHLVLVDTLEMELFVIVRPYAPKHYIIGYEMIYN